MAKDILFGTEAQSLIKEGVDKLANAVKATLGPRGRNVLIEKNFRSTGGNKRWCYSCKGNRSRE